MSHLRVGSTLPAVAFASSLLVFGLAPLACQGSGGDAGTGGGPSDGGSMTTGGSTAAGGSGGRSEPAGGQGGEGGGLDSGGAAATGGSGGSSPSDPLDCNPPDGDVPLLELEPVVEDISAPIYIDHIPGDPRMFVVSYRGTVSIYDNGVLLETPFLDLTSKVTSGGERGLLGFAFHPEYATNGLFYVHYSAGSDVPGANVGDTVIEEYRVADDESLADAESGRIVLIVPQPYANHNGGTITFGPDGLLYIGLGDGGSGGDPQGHGQDPDLLGSLLRINPLKEGDKAYTTPAGNYPGASPEVFGIGLRNPFRYTFDGCTGDLYIGDVGQDEWEEIDFLKAGATQRNFGWNTLEGTHCFPPGGADCPSDGLVMPVAEHGHSDAKSITGGSVYRGASIPGIRGAYFYADYTYNKVWWLRVDRETGVATAPVSVTQDLNPKSIVAIESGPDGELYFVSIGSLGDSPTPGGIYRLIAAQ